MARQTRQERRARRARQQPEPALAGGPPQRPPTPPPTPTLQGESEPRRPRVGEARRIPGSGFFHFIQESIGELKKVEWPSQKAVISGTAVVLVACVIVGTYLWLNDQLWQYVVQHVLLR
jgi:preprotein translocase SecE subunit